MFSPKYTEVQTFSSVFTHSLFFSTVLGLNSICKGPWGELQSTLYNQTVAAKSAHLRKLDVCFVSFRGWLEDCLNTSRWGHPELPRAYLESIHHSFPDKNPSRKKSTNLSHRGKQHPGAPSALSMRLLCFRTSRYLLLPAWFLPDSTSLCQSPRRSGSAGCLSNRPLSAWVATLQLPLFRRHPWVRHFPKRSVPSMGLLSDLPSLLTWRAGPVLHTWDNPQMQANTPPCTEQSTKVKK